jgi:hypothetical protein
MDFCFMAMNHENEQIIKEKNLRYTNRGGEFISVSPSAANNIYEMSYI